MSLIARFGRLDRALVVEEIETLAPWKSRMRPMARFLSAAMISGPLAVRNWRWSSPVTTSLTRWGRFSIPRCPWIQTATTSGRAWSMGSEQTRVDHLNSRLRSDCLSAAILARFLAVLGGLGASDPDHHEAQEHGQERQGQAQDVSAGWHDGTCLSPAPSPPEHPRPGRGGEELGRR